MINTNRNVPVTKTDLLSLYGLIIKQTETDLVALEAGDILGNFTLEDGTAPVIANQPAVVCDFADGVDAGTVYFMADNFYTGFTVAGVAVETDGDEVVPGSDVLYMAELASGAVTITKIGF